MQIKTINGRRVSVPTEWWEHYHIPCVWVEVEFYFDQPDTVWWIPVHDALAWDTGYQKDLPEGVASISVDWDSEL